MNTPFVVGQEVAIVRRVYMRRQHDTIIRDTTTITRLTDKCVFTANNGCWARTTGYSKYRPLSRPDPTVRISNDPVEIAAAKKEKAAAREEELKKKAKAAERNEWLNRSDVKLARQLSRLVSHTEDEAINFWLTLGEPKLASLIEELSVRGAFAHLK